MARIRTIKPEFWTDEDMSEVSEAACLLAIGLLNYADDEGYFNANPKLIKAAIFPIREQSGSIPVLMHELSSVGYISLFSGHDGKIYGLVNNFAKHQVINKAKSSIIRDLCVVPYEYGTDTEPLLPGREGKGKEGKGKPPLIGGEKNSPVDNSAGDSEPDPDANNALLNGYVAPGGMSEFGKFQMRDDWKPDHGFIQRAALWGVNLEKEITPFELAGFITYWKAEGKAFHHDQWQQKLARSVQVSRSRPAAQQQRDVNAVSEPDTTVPKGFRGYVEP